MFTGLTVLDEAGVFQRSFPLRRAGSGSSFSIAKIDGLGPVSAQISTSSFAVLDGELFQSAKTGRRNIVMTLVYKPNFAANESAGKLRRELYSILPPKAGIRLQLTDTDYEKVEIDARVESHEPTIFEKEPAVQISFLAPMPYFRSLKITEVLGYNNLPILAPYRADANTGFIVDTTLLRATNRITVSNGVDPGIVVDDSFIAGDRFVLSTVRGTKYVRKFRNSVRTSLLDNIVSGSLASEIGPRVRSVTVSTGGPNDTIVRLEYIQKYVGV